MTAPMFHAQSSVRKWGGNVSDYLPLHEWMDATKETFCDFRHRALRHHSQGIFEGERVFGASLTNSAGKVIPVRLVLEWHVREDCGGVVPSVADWLSRIKPEAWMSRGYSKEALQMPEASSS
jgi:hypothetical protein